MKTYECIQRCYADDSRFYRVGDRRIVEDSYNHQTLDEKFKLISEDKPKKKAVGDDIMAGVKEYAKKNKITAAEQAKIFIKAGAVDAHDKLRALVEHVEGK